MAKEGKVPAGSIPVDNPPVEDKVVEEEPKLFAGKFEKPEDLEASYVELEKKLGEQRGEVGTMRKTVDTLTASLNDLKARQEPEAPPEETISAPDINAILKDVGAQYEAGDLGFEGAMDKVVGAVAQIMDFNSEAKIENTRAELTDLFTKTLQERDQNSAVEQFHKDNPDYKDFIGSEDYQKILEEDEMHDDYSAYKVFKERIRAQEAIDNAERIKTGSEPSQLVATKPGHSVQQNTKNRTLDMGELKSRMRKKLDEMA